MPTILENLGGLVRQKRNTRRVHLTQWDPGDRDEPRRHILKIWGQLAEIERHLVWGFLVSKTAGFPSRERRACAPACMVVELDPQVLGTFPMRRHE